MTAAMRPHPVVINAPATAASRDSAEPDRVADEVAVDQTQVVSHYSSVFVQHSHNVQHSLGRLSLQSEDV